jgi:two-component system sensor histidine kinase MprB
VSLRARLAVLAAVAVAIAVVVVSAVAYRASRDQQVSALDAALEDRAAETAARAAVILDLDTQLRATGRFFEPEGLLQIVGADGRSLRPNGQEPLPVSAADSAVARGEGDVVVRDVTIDGRPHRMVTVPVPDERIRPGFGPPGPSTPAQSGSGGSQALQLAESREALDDSLAGLRRSLILVALLGVGGAALAGTVVARRALRPVGDLTRAAEHVAATQDLEASIEVERQDELGRLAGAFNEMLAALDQSRLQQQQLVTDASHELRTPLTSLRTNVELLQRADSLPHDERVRIVDDAVEELEELSALVAELVDLATDSRRAAEAWEEVPLSTVAERAAERGRRRRPGPIEVTTDASVVAGNPTLLDRALANLVDNAAKWSGEDDPIDVEVDAGRLSVRDRGPGIPEAERDRVFDRFYRTPGSQDRPGSGLGLAIVDQIVGAHGGTVFIEDPDEGTGVVVGFVLPPAPEPPAPAAPGPVSSSTVGSVGPRDG